MKTNLKHGPEIRIRTKRNPPTHLPTIIEASPLTSASQSQDFWYRTKPRKQKIENDKNVVRENMKDTEPKLQEKQNLYYP